MSKLRTACAWLIFPSVAGGAVAASILMMRGGAAPLRAYVVPFLLAFPVVILAERIFPHRRAWNRSRADVPTDAAWALTVYGTVELLRPLLYALAIALAGARPAGVGLGLWPEEWPLIAQLALALTIAEFFQYWVHRLEHERDWLWRFHATHHSAPRLYWLNASRFHPIDIGLLTVAAYLPLYMLGAGERVITLWGLFAAVHGIFQHANVHLRLGPLNWIFSMAELHRWHHSRTLEEANTNYGQNLIIWDTLFGTRFLPNDREPPAEIGIADLPGFPMTYLAQLISPVRWKQIKQTRAALASAGSRT